jgi:PAS domain S-box-containing protein
LQRANDERTAELARSMIALRESEERFKAFMNHTAAVAWMKDVEGRYVYINPSLEQRFNFSIETVRGKTDFDLFPRDVAKQLREHDLAILASNQAAELQEEAPVEDGSMRQWMTFKFPFRDASGNQFVGGMAFDVTERTMLEQQVRQADKLAAIGQLTTGLAHEIGTPLGIIAGRAETLVRKLGPDDPSRAGLEVILRQIDRITKLVDQLCAFARSRPVARRSISVAPLVREVLSLVDHQVRDHHIAVDVDCPDDLPPLVADPDQIQQVLLNLVVNAIQAMPDGGRLAIRAGRTVPRRHREDPLKDRYLKIEVVDEGVGIAPESLSKVFDPFYTTKDVGKGTGLGLAISSRIAQSHGGWMRVKSRPGEGATFSTYLPLPSESCADGITEGAATHV